MDMMIRLLGERLFDSLKAKSGGGPVFLRRSDGRTIRVIDSSVAAGFVETELQYVKAQTYDVTRVALKWRDFIPEDTSAPEGAEAIAWDQYDWWGEAAIVENWADDFPRVDVVKERYRNGIWSLGAAYGYSIQDMRAISMTGSRLDLARALQARRAIEARLEKIAIAGETSKNKTGFSNDANVTLDGTTLSWTMGSDPFVVKRQLSAFVSQIPITTQQVWIPDTLGVSPKAYEILNQLSFSAYNPRSVLSVFLEDNPYIKRVDQWYALAGKGADGVKDRIVAYKRDPMVLTMENPVPYEEFPPEVRGAKFLTGVHCRTAGCIVRYPMAMRYADGTFDPSSS